MSHDEIRDWLEFQRKMNTAYERDDAQEFLQIINLGGHLPKVWFRPLGPDFMASCQVKRGKVWRGVEATGESRSQCLQNLAAAVAAKLYPGKR